LPIWQTRSGSDPHVEVGLALHGGPTARPRLYYALRTVPFVHAPVPKLGPFRISQFRSSAERTSPATKGGQTFSELPEGGAGGGRSSKICCLVGNRAACCQSQTGVTRPNLGWEQAQPNPRVRRGEAKILGISHSSSNFTSKHGHYRYGGEPIGFWPDAVN
jgi:hypothetical protein